MITLIKGLIVFFLLVIIPKEIVGQEWFPSGTTWSYCNSFWGQPSDDNVFEIIGDSLIGTRNCKILQKKYWSCDFRRQTEYIYKENDKLFTQDEGTNFQLLYDFSAEVGDTIVVEIYEDVLPSINLYTRIDSIKTIEINNKEFKKFYVSDGFLDDEGNIEFHKSTLPHNHIIIEDIGRLGIWGHYLETGFCDQGYSFPLKTMFHPELGDVNFLDLFLSDTNILKDNISIYPNPFIDYIEVLDKNSEIESLFILNFQGAVIKKLKLDEKLGDKFLSEFNGIPNGNYFIIPFDKKGKSLSTYKLVRLKL